MTDLDEAANVDLRDHHHSNDAGKIGNMKVVHIETTARGPGRTGAGDTTKTVKEGTEKKTNVGQSGTRRHYRRRSDDERRNEPKRWLW